MTTKQFKDILLELKGFEFTDTTTVWMVPTPRNGLTEVTQYNIIGYQITKLGLRIELAICKKQKGVESLYAATAGMFGESIFLTKDEADQFMLNHISNCGPLFHPRFTDGATVKVYREFEGYCGIGVIVKGYPTGLCPYYEIKLVSGHYWGKPAPLTCYANESQIELVKIEVAHDND